jgi:hypothetical protein
VKAIYLIAPAWAPNQTPFREVREIRCPDQNNGSSGYCGTRQVYIRKIGDPDTSRDTQSVERGSAGPGQFQTQGRERFLN